MYGLISSVTGSRANQTLQKFIARSTGSFASSSRQKPASRRRASSRPPWISPAQASAAHMAPPEVPLSAASS